MTVVLLWEALASISEGGAPAVETVGVVVGRLYKTNIILVSLIDLRVDHKA